MTQYRLADLLDLTILQHMADAHYKAAGMPIGIIDAIDGSILVGSGWQDICTKFHRADPISLARCQESDLYIRQRLVAGEACGYKCKNGLWDIGMPIIVAGEHVATLFLGQFFYEGEIPDRDFFKRQAEELGYDLDGYLAALDQVPTFARDKVDSILQYDTALVVFISDLAEHFLLRKAADEAALKSEDELKQQTKFLQMLIDTIPSPVFYKDREGRYLGCNRAFEQMYGTPKEFLAGKSVYEISPKELADVYFAADKELFDHPGTQQYEAELQSPAMGRRDVIFHKATFDGPDGTPTGLVGVVVDITDRKLADLERQKLREQLAQSQKMASVARLAGGVAHDFNNMLSIILGYSELILLGLTPTDPLYREMEQIQKAAERSRDVARQLLAFARKEVVTPRVLDLNAAMENGHKVLQKLVGEDINVVWEPGRDLWPVFLDPSQLDQILANLCVNSRDAISDVGKIVIATGKTTLDAAYCSTRDGLTPGDYVWLSVSDTGRGIDEETLGKIFEPFFTTKGVGQGTGLGLATVYGIVKQNRGSIDVESEPGVGTTFTIYLPRYLGGAAEEASPTLEGAPAGRGETVLVVEDEPAILELTEHILAGHNYSVLAAGSPSEALRVAQTYAGDISLLITDMVMPEMNGRDLAEQLRCLRPQLKCLYMSGYAPDTIADRGLLHRGDNYIQKPFSPGLFLATVRNALDRDGGATPGDC